MNVRADGRMLLRAVALASLLAASWGCNSRRADEPRAMAMVENVPAHASPHGSPHGPHGVHAAAASGGATAIAEDQIRADVFFLASRRLEGRGVETQGLEVAADYIATRFEALGLKTLPGLNGYFQ